MPATGAGELTAFDGGLDFVFGNAPGHGDSDSAKKFPNSVYMADRHTANKSYLKNESLQSRSDDQTVAPGFQPGVLGRENHGLAREFARVPPGMRRREFRDNHF